MEEQDVADTRAPTSIDASKEDSGLREAAQLLNIVEADSNISAQGKEGRDADQSTTDCTPYSGSDSKISAQGSSSSRMYCGRYERNNSKRWDGRETSIDGEWLESLYSPSELVEGKHLSLHWQTKKTSVLECCAC